MAYKAGSVIVELLAKISDLRKQFADAKGTVRDFGTQVNQTDAQVRTFGKSLRENLAEPKSVFGWINNLRDSVNQVNYVAGKGFVATGKAAQEMGQSINDVSQKMSKARDNLALASENAANAALNLARAESSNGSSKTAYAENNKAQARLNAARAAMQEASASSAGVAALNANSAASNQNAIAKNNMANASRRAQMADLDLIFAAMYAQLLLAGMVYSLGNIIKKGNESQMAIMGLEATVRSLGESTQKATDIFNDLKSDGFMSNKEVATSMKNLLMVGYSLDEARTLIDRFKDSAAFGRQASLGFGEAVERTTEGIRLGLSTLSDGAGMAKNLGQILKENGYAETDLTRITTDAGVRQAMYNGILKETMNSAGNAALATKTLTGSIAAMGTAWKDFDYAMTNALSGPLKAVIDVIIPIIRYMTQWMMVHPQLTSVMIITTVALTALVAAMLIGQWAAAMLWKALQAFMALLATLTSPIAILIAALIMLGVIFVANKDDILSACRDLYNGWRQYFTAMYNVLDSFLSNLGRGAKGIVTILWGIVTMNKDLLNRGVDDIKNGMSGMGQALTDGVEATKNVISGTYDTLKDKFKPLEWAKTAWNKVTSIFDPVSVDMSSIQAVGRPTADPKEKKGKKGQSPYQIAMREYEHMVHMEELKEYSDKLAWLDKIGATVAKTDEEQMDWEEKRFDLIKANKEEEIRYATELMDYNIKSGNATYQDQIDLIKKQLDAETDKFKKLKLMNDLFDAQKAKADEDSEKRIAEIMSRTTKYGDPRNSGGTIGSVITAGWESIDKVIAKLRTLQKSYEDMGKAGKDAAQKCKDAIAELDAITQQWVDKFVDGLAQVAIGTQKLSDFIDNMFRDIAMSWVKYQLQQMLGGFLGNIFGGMPWLYKSPTGTSSSTVEQHDGGIVPRFHTGGIIGPLESDERVIIAQSGERMLNRREAKAYDAGMAAAGSDTRAKNQITIMAMDSQSFSEFAKKNANIFGSAIAYDFSANGPTKKLLIENR